MSCTGSAKDCFKRLASSTAGRLQVAVCSYKWSNLAVWNSASLSSVFKHDTCVQAIVYSSLSDELHFSFCFTYSACLFNHSVNLSRSVGQTNIYSWHLQAPWRYYHRPRQIFNPDENTSKLTRHVSYYNMNRTTSAISSPTQDN